MTSESWACSDCGHLVDTPQHNLGCQAGRIENEPDPAAARPDWDDYLMRIAHETAARSTCPRRQVGAVLVRDKRIIATGYNGSPAGQPHCTEIGCHLAHGHCKRAVHAELNALLYAHDAHAATLYATDRPCLACANAIVTAGVARVVYERDYAADTDEVARVFSLANIEVGRYEPMAHAGSKCTCGLPDTPNELPPRDPWCPVHRTACKEGVAGDLRRVAEALDRAGAPRKVGTLSLSLAERVNELARATNPTNGRADGDV